MKKFLGILLVALIMISCEELSTTGTVKVSNSTGSTIIVDVNDGAGNWLGERTLYSGGSTTYTAEEGAIDGAARFSGTSYWYYAERYLTAGSTVYIDWVYTKKSTDVNQNSSIMGGENGTLTKISKK
jgi:hypothetical protein